MPIRAEAIVFPEPNTVEIRTLDVPDPGPDEVLVQNEVSGVSQGTERWQLLGRYDGMGNDVAANYPFSPGYQSAGTVLAVGSQVTDVQPGAKVMLSGTRLQDPSSSRRGSAGHVSHLVARRADVNILGDNVDMAEASLFVMAGVGRHGVRLSHVKAGEHVVVIGQGMIGQMSAQAARQRGAHVITADLAEKRVKLSAAYSADRAVDASSEDLEEVVRDACPDGVDIVIDTTGNVRLFDQCLRLIRYEGRICLQGYYPDPVVIDFHSAHTKRVTVFFPCAWDREKNQALADDISAHKFAISPLITHRIPFREAPEAFRLVTENPDQSLGMVLNWTDSQ